MIRTEIVRRPDREVTRVTFELPASTWADSVHVVGDFNGWNPDASPMGRAHDEAWRLIVDLEQPGRYRCAYLVDGCQWRTEAGAEWAPGGPAGDCMVVRARHRVPAHASRPGSMSGRRASTPAPTTSAPALVFASDTTTA
jgi:1,4-alpha-glucan branching enzyme